MFTRRATALGAVAAALTVGLGGGVANASTRAAEPVVSLTTYELALPAKGAVAPWWQWSVNARHVDASDVKLTVDARRLAKVAKVQFPGNCTAHGLVATCDEWFQGDAPQAPQQVAGVTQLEISALPGAKPGATGSYTVTGRSGSVRIAGGTSLVTVGGPDFKFAPVPVNLGLRSLKSVVSQPITFTNVGNRPANGSRVLFFASPGMTFADHYANCRYGHAGPHDGHPVDSVALCTFPGAMRVGEQVALAHPLRLRFTSRALYEGIQADVAPAGDAEAWNWLSTPGGFRWTQGRGPVLGLQVLKSGRRNSAPAGTAQIAQTYDHEFMTGVRARNVADFGTTGFSAKAVQGRTVKVRLTLTNHGPADLNTGINGGVGLEITPPPGTTVVGSSTSCSLLDGTKPQGPYFCASGEFGQLSGTTLNYTLTLRVDKVVAGATGTVRVRYEQFAPAGQNPYRAWYDPDTRNDTAVIRLTA